MLFIFSVFFNFSLPGQTLFHEPCKDYFFACGQAGGELIIPVTSDPKSFNPIVAQETSTTQITSLIFEGLTRTHPLTLEVLPNLAKKWETIDGKNWIFYLREDVYWSDGVQFTADDVLFTFNELIYNPDIPTSSKDIFTVEGKTISVEKINDYAVRFILPFSFAPFLRSLSHDILPAHKYRKLVLNKNFTFSMGVDAKPDDIVGTGAFRLKKYLPGERVVLERNPLYWKKDSSGNKLPYLDRVLFIILPSLDTALLKFLEQEIDYYPLRAQDISVLGPRQKTDNFTMYNAGPGLSSQFLVFNQNPGVNSQTKKVFVTPYKLQWFRSKQFRQAISYAVNRKKIIDVVLNGLGIPQYSTLNPSHTLFYDKNIQEYPYDVGKAKQLLKDLGFSDRDNDGVLEDRQGNRLEINFFTVANDTERMQISTLIKKDMETVGIKVNFLPLDFNTLVNKLTVSFDWEMILIGLTGTIDPYFGKNVWSYRGSLHVWNSTGKALDPYEEEIESIFDLSAKTLDEEKRKILFSRWQQIVSEELPLIHTIVPYTIFAVRNKFGNVYPTVYGGAFSEIEYIYRYKKNDVC